MGLLVRRVRDPAALPLIYPLIEDFYRLGNVPTAMARCLDRLPRIVKQVMTYFLVAYDDGKPVAYAWADLTLDGDLWIRQAYSQMTEASRLLRDDLFRIAKETGCRRIGGSTCHDERWAQAFCRLYGAQIENVMYTMYRDVRTLKRGDSNGRIRVRRTAHRI